MMNPPNEVIVISGIVEALNANNLRLIIKETGIQCNDKRSREGLIASIQPNFRYRTDLLDVISKDGLRQICDVFEISSGGSIKELSNRINDFTRTTEGHAKIRELISFEDDAQEIFSEDTANWAAEPERSANLPVNHSNRKDGLSITQDLVSLNEVEDRSKSVEIKDESLPVISLNRLDRHANREFALNKISFQVQSTPCFDLGGTPIHYADLSRSWEAFFDVQHKIFQYCNIYRDKYVFLEKSAEEILCIQATEDEVNDVKHTIGRLALTAVGTDLFWKGRRGGVGAALLDLSVRGMDKKTLISGNVIFNDFTVISFKAPVKEFEEFVTLVGEEYLDDDALEAMNILATELKDRLDDGSRVIYEMANEMVDSFAHCKRLAENAEEVQNFRQRTEAREVAKEKFAELMAEGAIMRALVHTNKVSFEDICRSVSKPDQSIFQELAKTVIYEGSVIDYQANAAAQPASNSSSAAVSLRNAPQVATDDSNQTSRKGFFKRLFG